MPSRPINITELNDLAAATTNARDKAFVLTMAATGARVAELAAAHVDQVLDADATLSGALRLPRARRKGKSPSTSKTLPPRALQALALWLQQHPAPHGRALLFCPLHTGAAPLTPRQWQRIIRAAATAAGIAGAVTPHSLRKFFGCSIYSATGQDLAITARALDHSNPASTTAYLMLDQARIQSAVTTIFDGDPRDLLPGFTPDSEAA